MTLYNSIIDFFSLYTYSEVTEYYCQNLLSRTHGPNVLNWFSIIRMGFGWFFGLVWFHIGTIGPSKRLWLLVLLDCAMKTLKTPILHNRSFKGPIICEIYKCFLINCVSELPEKGKHLKQPQFWRLQSVWLFGDVFDNTLPLFFSILHSHRLDKWTFM